MVDGAQLLGQPAPNEIADAAVGDAETMGWRPRRRRLKEILRLRIPS